MRMWFELSVATRLHVVVDVCAGSRVAEVWNDFVRGLGGQGWVAMLLVVDYCWL